MNVRTPWWLPLAVAALPLLAPLAGRADDPSSADVATLKKQLGDADPERAIAYLRKQVLTDEAAANLRKLIEQMGDKKFAVRQEASRKLVAAGPAALPLLREATANPDKEIASRANRCVTEIETV